MEISSNHLRNLEDMLATYNRLTEKCFTKCISNMNSDKLTGIESECVNSCSSKSVNGSHRIMSTFMEIQGRKQEAARVEGDNMAREQAAAQLVKQAQVDSTKKVDESTTAEVDL